MNPVRLNPPLWLTDERDYPVPRSAVERVYQSLYERIVSLALAPDTTLSRQALCQEYEVSQTPVREALQQLEQVGLVRIFPQSRTQVTRIDLAQLHENHCLRQALECEMIRRLSLAASADCMAELQHWIELQEACVDQVEDAVSAEVTQSFAMLDERFHQALFRHAGQSGLFVLSRSRLGHMARVRCLDLPSHGKMAQVIGQHKALVEAIAQGDPDIAMAAMRVHLEGTISRIPDLQARFPDFFSG